MSKTASHRSVALFLALTCALTLGLPACARTHDMGSAPPSAPTSAPSAAAGSTSPHAIGPRYRVVRVQTTLRVRAVPAALDALRTLVDHYEGYIDHSNLASDSAQQAGVSARVPAARLAAFRAELPRIGAVQREQESSTDVSEEHEDRAARLRNLRAAEARLLALLGDRTGALGDVLAVEQHLVRAREQIEQLEAQQQQLDAQIAYASVDVDLVSEPAIVASLGTGARFRLAAADGLAAARDTLVALGLLLLRAGPTLAILGAIAGVVLAARRRIIARRAPVLGPRPAHPANS